MSNLPDLVLLARLLDVLPYEAQSIYNLRARGGAPWLTRIGPEGRRTRALWVKVPELQAWAAARGLRIPLGGEK